MTAAAAPADNEVLSFERPPPSLSLVFFVLALGAFAIGTAEFASMSLVPMIAQELSITIPSAGDTIVAYALGVGVGAPIIAFLSARFSHKHTLVGLTALYALGNALSAIAPTYSLLVLCRFFSGLPHGAYFGSACIIASSLVPPGQRTRAVSRVVLGLTIATIGGVPIAHATGEYLGWRWAFVVIAVLALLTTLLAGFAVPTDVTKEKRNPFTEVRALKNRQVWLTLGIGAVGFGGIFSVYTYLTAILEKVLHAPPSLIPVVLAIFGVGMTTGTIVCAWAADRKIMLTMGGILLVNTAALAGFSGSAHSVWELMPVVFMIGCGGGLGTVIQSRLLEVAVGARSMAAALNQTAFNLSNAVGPWLGGLSIAAGFGWTSVGWVGCVLAFGGFMIWLLTVGDIQAKARRNAILRQDR